MDIKRLSQNRFCKKFLGILFFGERVYKGIHDEPKNKITTKFAAKDRACNSLFNNFLKKIRKNLLTPLLIAAVCSSPIHSSYGSSVTAKQGVRDINDNADYTDGGVIDTDTNTSITVNRVCKTENIVYDPWDANWEPTNKYCRAFIISTMAAVAVARMIASAGCVDTQMTLENAVAQATMIPLSPTMLVTNAKASAKCGALLSSGQYGQAAWCCGGMAATIIALGVAFAALSIIWAAAKEAQQHGRVCGHDWNVWTPEYYDEDGSGLEDDVEYWQFGKYGGLSHDANSTTYDFEEDCRGSYQKCLEDMVSDGLIEEYCGDEYDQDGQGAITCRYYREYLYGGQEYTDNGGDEGKHSCNNPWGDDEYGTAVHPNGLRAKMLGYITKKQRYYMRGPKLAPHFACHRFAYYDNDDSLATLSAKEAFDCCNKRSQNTICIENYDYTSEAKCNKIDYEADDYSNYTGVGFTYNTSKGCSITSIGYNHKFCKIGEECKVGDIWFNVYSSVIANNYICAKTYSVCPYNHPLGGGTEREKYNDAGDALINYCQYLKHCVKKPDLTYVSTSILSGAYFDGSCSDWAGDSQNMYSYETYIVNSSSKHFSAPVAECFKETMENLFLNEAGTTVCADSTEDPDENDECESGYLYQKGEEVSNESFFEKIQSYIKEAIKIVLTLSIVFIGVNILLGTAPMPKKEIMMYIVKMGLVVYFALGTAWQDYFFDGVFNAAGAISDIMLTIDEDEDDPDPPVYDDSGVLTSGTEENELLDGCQFPRYNYADEDESTKYNDPSYPDGKSYLRIWDTLDCKIAMALGFGPDVTIPNFALMVLGGLFWGPLGLMYLFAVFIFAFYLISLTIRALYVFLASSLAIVLMIYISPITITTCLFKKTNTIFNNWLNSLIGFVLQPVILFAYLGILINIFDDVLIGDATFKGEGTQYAKTIMCTDESWWDVVDDNSGGYGDDSSYDSDENIADSDSELVDDALETLDDTADTIGNAADTLASNAASIASSIFTHEGDTGDNSLYCIFKIKDLETSNDLAMLGIGLPALADLNLYKIKTIATAALIMFIFTQVLDKMLDVARAIVGGEIMPKQGKGAGTMEMAKSAYGMARGAQTRALRGGMKLGKAALGAAGTAVTNTGKVVGALSSPGDKDDGNKNNKNNSSSSSSNQPRPSPSTK